MNKIRISTTVAVLATGTLLAAVGTGALKPGGWVKSAKERAAASSGRTTTTTSGSVTIAKKPVKPVPLVKIDFEAPKYKKDLPLGLMFSSGWPLTIRAVATPLALGITTNGMPSEFPTTGETGYVIIQDPDNCLELPEPYFRGPPGYACSLDPSDETYMEFSNDIDLVGVVDGVGNPGRGTALGDPAVSGEPTLNSAKESWVNGQPSVATESVAVGTPTGGSVLDGVGYGADDDFPGLVLLSPTGTGLVLDANFNPPYVRQQRNLAGFLNTVSYELRDPTGSTVVTAGMVVPQSLIAPLMQIDDCVGANGLYAGCADDSAYRIDGGPVQTTPNTTGSAYPYNIQALYPRVFNTATYELRAFVVSGIAPSVLVDMNADGAVTAADATLAGYHVISNEETVRLRQYHGDICGGVPFLNVVYGDYDGNGRVLSYLVCPAGPGVLSKPPT